MGKREAQIENALVKRIEAIGGRIRKAQWIGRRGCPDRFVMLPERARWHVMRTAGGGIKDDPRNPWVECKAPGAQLEGHQAREIKKMRELGELVLVIDSLDQIDRYFPLELP